MGGRCILVLGGARSGKSRYAQETARRLGGDVLFVATAEPLDDEMRWRIEAHRQERPPTWRTVEATRHVGRATDEAIADAQVVIVDCLTLLVSNVLIDCVGGDDDVDATRATLVDEQIGAEIAELLACIDRLPVTFILVSNEVGMGLVPDNRLGRIFRDCLGRVNQEIAARADEVYLMVAGTPLKLPASSRPPTARESGEAASRD